MAEKSRNSISIESFERESTRSCLECGAPLKGRSDRKFCDSDCRNAFNNRRRSAIPAVRDIDRILHSNRLVFASFELNSPTPIPVLALKTRGFHFGFFTHWVGGDPWLYGLYEYEFGDFSGLSVWVRKSG